ncbi:hypothetical protein RRG08_029196 [Elysia crispata]|uniref:Uncharacterized protein n=1 Tax=Elysia crispata TaxID=231223 RepID=A0AAE1DZH3_9GAST|nr:hypothetical protein RRG08_029196 [Elysia crispata]
MASQMLQRLIGSSVDETPSFAPEQRSGSSPHLPNAALHKTKSEVKGGQLFELFVLDQVGKNKVSSLGLKDFVTRPAECTQEVCDTATRLCQMAVVFSESEERQKVKDAALTVSPHMMRQELSTVLQAMLAEYPSLDEGVLVLFFFCLDLSARLLESEHKDAWEVLAWCRAGLDAALGPYVHARGGWVAVGSSAAQALTTGLSLLSQVRRLVAL